MVKYAIIVGINGYHESLGTLKYCVSDAELMYETLMSEECGFLQDNALLLTDNQDSDKSPTYGNIHSWLGKWLSMPEKDDLVVVYFAGHGRHANGDSMLVPADATLDTVNVTGIKISYVQDLLERCKAKQKVLFLDTCHSGSGRDVMPMTAQFYNQLQSSEGIYTIASCKQDQISHECDEKKHGIFTWSLTDAIKTAAPNNQGQITLDAIFEKCRQAIINWCKPRRITQIPVRISSTTGEITLATKNIDMATQVNRAREEISFLKEELLKQQIKQIELQEGIKQVSGKQTIWKVSDWKAIPFNHFIWVWVFSGCGTLFISVTYVCAKLGLSDGLSCLILGVIAAAIVPCIVLFSCYRKNKLSRNKHYIDCAQKAWESSDYVQGLAALRELSGIGVNKGRASTIAENLGELAQENGDVHRAVEIYKIATRFKSSLAKKELEKL